MARHIRFDDQDKRALRALDDFTISADGETATVAGEMEIEMVRSADDDGARLWLTITLPGREELDVTMQRTALLRQLGIEAKRGNMSGDEKIVEFPKAEVPPEERACRLKTEVDRLASLPGVEWLFYVEVLMSPKSTACRAPVMKAMIEATIKANEKKAGEDKAEDRQRIQRVEKEQDQGTARGSANGRKRREQERAAKEDERKRKEKESAFEAIVKLPRLAHEARLAELAKRSGEDLDFLRDEFAAFVSADTSEISSLSNHGTSRSIRMHS